MNAPTLHTDISDLHSQEIHADKILLIHQNMPLIMFGNLLGAIPLTVVLWSEDNAIQLMFWIGILYLVTFIRWLHYRTLNATNKDQNRIFLQGNAYTLLALLAGATWGSAGVLFFNPDAVAQFTFLILALLAMISGSMTSLSSRPLSYIAYAMPAMIPIIIKLFMQGLAFYNWMGLGALTYLILTLAFSRNIHRSINQSLFLKYENLELVENLKQQTQTANKANKDKSRFLAAASHDLRQPLHAVNLFVETLSYKITDEEQRHDLSRIRRGLDSLNELFDALLDITRLDTEAVQVNFVDFDLDELLQKLADQFSPEITSKQLSLKINNCNKIIRSDPILLERMLRNLLSNAIRYTEEGKIEIRCNTNDNKHLQIHTRDTGIGIPKDHIEDIFNEFTQLHNPERDRSKGLGLGLAIVKRISDLLDHPLQIHSELGKGTDFMIQVPLGKSVVGIDNITPSVLAENKLQDIRVLVIDNETDILDAMRDLLVGWGCHYTSVDSTKAALKLIQSGKHPDFILADYRMPGDLNGCELVRKIRDQIGEFPALIISGDIGSDVINEIEENGLILLSKPLKPAQLRLAMTRLLS